jgi:cytochrome P450
MIPMPTAARFDCGIEAWVLTRYVDVLTALREPRLTATGARGGGEPDPAGHLRFRTHASAAAAEMLRTGLASEEPLARSMAGALPRDRAVDLVSELAKPWSVEIAHHLVCPSGNPERMTALAGDIFAAAAEPRDAALQARAEESTRELSSAFSGQLAAFRVQAFAALSQTLPCFLANAWLALLNDPEKAEILRAQPRLLPAAIEELLRHSGPARAQFRLATEEVMVGGVSIARGDRVALMLAAANRDPEQFPEPDRLDFGRGLPRHLALGEGRHSCIGAALVRGAAAVATAAFIEYFAGARREGTVEWRGGFAISGPASLRVSR